MAKATHPKVKEFKEFVKKHPSLIKEVRDGNENWQDLFEDWYLLGEDDPRWSSYKEGSAKETKKDKESSSSTSNWMSQIGDMMKKMDPDQLQHHIHNLSQALGAVQGVVSQFQSKQPTGDSTQTKKQSTQQPSHPFTFRKD